MLDIKELKSRYDKGDRDFSDGNFSHANFSFQTLSQATFSGADLSYAILSSAQLDNCDFKNANLSFSNFSNADLSGSNLCGANLEGANLATAKVQNAVYDVTTILPQGINLQSLGAFNLDAPKPSPAPIVETKTDAPTLDTPPLPPQQRPSPADKIQSRPPPAVPTKYKLTPIPDSASTQTNKSASIPNTSSSSQVKTQVQPKPQRAPGQKKSQNNYNTTSFTPTPENNPTKKSNKGIIIWSIFILGFLGFCAPRWINSVSTNNQYEPSNPFDSVRFPLSACGDSMPSNPNDYPVDLYPVFVDYSAYNLREVTRGYCQDAYPNDRANGSSAIQVASFTTRYRAQQFALFMQAKIGSGDVGYPTTFYQ